MSEGLSQFTINEPSGGYWRVTFSNPPLNLLDPDMILELQRLMDLIEAEATLRSSCSTVRIRTSSSAVTTCRGGPRPLWHPARPGCPRSST